ncbi:hypothetical protein NMY22_g4930 [Coprinellus aureogranulatus]|nr:hypothetical protein NMY22_g4930 [Coprinellus aureogranulatus]
MIRTSVEWILLAVLALVSRFQYGGMGMGTIHDSGEDGSGLREAASSSFAIARSEAVRSGCGLKFHVSQADTIEALKILRRQEVIQVEGDDGEVDSDRPVHLTAFGIIMHPSLEPPLHILALQRLQSSPSPIPSRGHSPDYLLQEEYASGGNAPEVTMNGINDRPADPPLSFKRGWPSRLQRFSGVIGWTPTHNVTTPSPLLLPTSTPIRPPRMGASINSAFTAFAMAVMALTYLPCPPFLVPWAIPGYTAQLKRDRIDADGPPLQ